MTNSETTAIDERADAPPAEAPVWTPSAAEVAASNVTRFVGGLPDELRAAVLGDGGFDYDALHAWSVREPAAFWERVWRFADVVAEVRADGAMWDAVVDAGGMMVPPNDPGGARWFTGSQLNFAENLLRAREGVRGDADAVVAYDERGRRGALSWDALRAEVAALAAALAADGVGVGDRVAGYLPNVPEAVVAMLAAASLGAIWSSCSPDFGVDGVVDRFGQIEPVVLVVADAYLHGGRVHDVRARAMAIADRLPTARRVVVVAGPDSAVQAVPIPRSVSWEAYVAPRRGAPPRFVRLPFAHPLYILYSSGTTGLPKGIVHSAGGTLLQHAKELALHADLRAGDRLFYYTTCGWMMWNWMASALALGTTLVLFDGAALRPTPTVLWEMAAAEEVAVFGTSAKYLALLEQEGVDVAASFALPALRAVLSTGSPLAPESYDYVATRVKPGVRLSSISGGTDIVSCFALGNPVLPVWRGELQCLGLGMAVAVFDDDGRPVRGGAGELVCTRPFPSMPVAFWNDSDGSKYRAAYFEQFPGVWRHGDWAELTAHPGQTGLVIHGRSDATLNPAGVRIGTAEIYRQVEQVDGVVESLVVEQQLGSGIGQASRLVLFVRLRDGVALDRLLETAIRDRLRNSLSANHVPRVIVAAPDLPRTLNGKLSEIAVREAVHGRVVRNAGALANPESLAFFTDHPRLRA